MAAEMETLKRAIKALGSQRPLASWLQSKPSEMEVSNWVSAKTPIPSGVLAEIRRRDEELRLRELSSTAGASAILKKDLIVILEGITARIAALERKVG